MPEICPTFARDLPAICPSWVARLPVCSPHAPGRPCSGSCSGRCCRRRPSRGRRACAREQTEGPAAAADGGSSEASRRGVASWPAARGLQRGKRSDRGEGDEHEGNACGDLTRARLSRMWHSASHRPPRRVCPVIPLLLLVVRFVFSLFPRFHAPFASPPPYPEGAAGIKT
eukprot:1085565-Pyramimonas_sp.AAC.1